MNLRKFVDSLGGRKLTVWVIVNILAYVAMFLDKLPPDQWANLEIWVSGIFLAANAAQKGIQKKVKKDEP